MSGRLARIFATCRAENRAALIVYLMAGDPDPERSLAYCRAVLAGGAEILEIGVPFSDPIADGPVIQAAAGRALAAGGDLRATLRLARALREEFPERGLVLMSYLNPLLGWTAGGEPAGDIVDGLLPVDLDPDDDAERLPRPLADGAVARVTLVADSTPPARKAALIRRAGGFTYFIARRGVTGERAGVPPGLLAQITELQPLNPEGRPIAVGFGLSRPEDVREVARVADGVIVGSALVRMVGEGASPAALTVRVRDLHDACQRAPARNPAPKT